MPVTNEPSRASALGAGLSWPLRRRWSSSLRPIDGRYAGPSSGPTEGGCRAAQAARTAIEMVPQEGLIVRCHSPSIEEDRHGREVEEASCAQPRFPGNRGEDADAQREGEEAEEDVAREVARRGLRPTCPAGDEDARTGWPLRARMPGCGYSPAAGRDLGASGESVLRKQSRRTVASGAEAWTVAPGRASNLAGCARPSRSARRATRGRDRRAPSALERVSHPQRHRRRVLGAVVPELRSSQLGPRPRVIPTCRSTARSRLLNRSGAR